MVTERARMPRNQMLLFGALFAAVVGLLALGYFLFVRADYVVLFQGLRPADASVVVTELDKRGTPYRLGDAGTTILVPEGEADAARVALAGSDAAARGQIGFELFNKSDMGLTNFAQKINYQRALQGELVRTIMLMDGVDSARVHLAIPERTLFRGDRAEPKAAVTVAMKPGQTADPARVAGIQQLVAAAGAPTCPNPRWWCSIPPARVISPAAPAEAALDRPATSGSAPRWRAIISRAGGGAGRAGRCPESNSRCARSCSRSGRAERRRRRSTRPIRRPRPGMQAGAPSGEGAGRNYRIRRSS